MQDPATERPRLGGRLNPAAIAIWSSQQAVGLVVLLVFGGPAGFGLPLATVGVVLTVIASVVRWYRFSWTVAGGNLVIDQGLLQRSRRVIPADRVQSVDMVRSVRHRLLRVVQVRVEVIGGKDTEGQLEALDADVAAAIQQALVGERLTQRDGTVRANPTQSSEPGPHLRFAADDTDRWPRQLAAVTPGQLVLAGLTGGRVGVIAVLLGGAQQLFGDRFEDTFQMLPTDLGLLAGVVLALGAVVAVFALSIVATVISYWNFTISRDGRELRISRGLLEQRLETVPLRRIQALRIEQNILRRPFGLAAVKADLAGRAGGGDSTSGLLMPIGTTVQAAALIADLLGSSEAVNVSLQPAPSRARRRYLVRGVAWPALFLAAALVAMVSGAPAWPAVVAPLAVGLITIPLAFSQFEALGHAQVQGVLVARTGVVIRRRVHVPVARIQRMTIRSSVFQRRLRLSDVDIGIARSGGWQGPRLPDLDVTHARALTATAVHQAVAASRRR